MKDGGLAVVPRLGVYEEEDDSPRLERSSTAVSTHGKFRPSTEEEEFQWRFNYANPHCKLLGQFNCALMGKILLQGKMYITNVCVGFYSVFNDSTFISLIPTLVLFEYNEVVSLQKKANAFIFNNSIEVVLRDGTRYFFTSYVNREKAFGLISAGVNALGQPSELQESEALPVGRNVHFSDSQVVSRRTTGMLQPGGLGAATTRLRSPVSSRHTPSKGSAAQASMIPVPSEMVGMLVDGYDAQRDTAFETAAGRRLVSLQNRLEFCLPMGIFDVPLETMYAKCVYDGTYDLVYQSLANSKDLSSDPYDNLVSWSELRALSQHRPITRRVTWDKKIENRLPIKALPEYAQVTEDVVLRVHRARRQFVRDSMITTTGVAFADNMLLHTRLIFSELAPGTTQLDSDMEIIWLKRTLLKTVLRSFIETEWITSQTVIRHAMLQTYIQATRSTGSTAGAPVSSSPKLFTDAAKTTYDFKQGTAHIPRRRRRIWWLGILTVSLMFSLLGNIMLLQRLSLPTSSPTAMSRSTAGAEL